jgi:hypothetical protein
MTFRQSTKKIYTMKRIARLQCWRARTEVRLWLMTVCSRHDVVQFSIGILLSFQSVDTTVIDDYGWIGDISQKKQGEAYSVNVQLWDVSDWCVGRSSRGYDFFRKIY